MFRNCVYGIHTTMPPRLVQRICCWASPICSANGQLGMKMWGIMMYTLRKNSVIHVDGLPWQPNAPNRTHIAFQNRASMLIVRATVSQMCRLWSSPIINKVWPDLKILHIYFTSCHFSDILKVSGTCNVRLASLNALLHKKHRASIFNSTQIINVVFIMTLTTRY